MNIKDIEKLIHEDHRQIDLEVMQHLSEQNIRQKRRHSKKMMALLVAILVLIMSTMIYAASEIGLLEWSTKFRSGYEDILADNPDCALYIEETSDDITIEILGFVVDELNGYLYYRSSKPEWRIDYNGVDVLNTEQLYGLQDGYEQKGFYGYVGLEEDLQIAIFNPFIVKDGEMILKINELTNTKGDSKEVNFEFTLPFTVAEVRNIPINKSKEINIPGGDEKVAYHINSVDQGITETRINIDLLSPEDSNIGVNLGDAIINNVRIEPVLGMMSWNNDHISYFPTDFENIASLKMEIDKATRIRDVWDEYEFYALPYTFSYEGYDVIIEESSDDPYTLGYKDTGYKSRDGIVFWGELYCKNKSVFYPRANSYTYVGDDRELAKLDDETITSLFIIGDLDYEDVGINQYTFDGFYSNQELQDMGWFDDKTQKSIIIQTVEEHYTIDKETYFYIDIKQVWKNMLSNLGFE